MELAERLFFLVTTIGQNPGITAPELARLCGTSTRNIYRDIRRLDEAGVQVMLQGNKGYYLVDGISHTPAHLGTEEYLALSLYPMLAGAQKLKQRPFQQAFQRAMEKILARFKVNDELVRLSQRIRIHAEPEDGAHDEIMQKVIEAILREVTITCTYHTMYRDELTTRMIDPYYLVPRGGHLYLVGFCHQRDEVRTFRLNRFQRIELTDKRFFIEDDFDINEYLAHLWGIKRDSEEITFRVRFSREVARYIKEERYEAPHTFVDQPDGSLLLTVTTRSADEFLRWMKQYGKHAELLEPQAYREQLREELNDMLQMYQKQERVIH